LPFLSLSDGESFAGWSKNSPIEKAVCDRSHIILKKLRHQVITFTAWEVGPYGIRVNTISPGAVEGERIDWVIRKQAEV
jgi:hypothetical protein